MSRKAVITIGDRVRARRLELKKSQWELAVDSGMRPESISRIEKGKSPASLASLHKLCPVLGLSLDELVGPQPGASHPKKGKKK
jgi:transcriptional regulator with XRE-family HTH domain